MRSQPFQRQPEMAAFMDEKEYESFLEKDAKRVAANVAEDKAEGLRKKMFAERRRKSAEPDTENIEQWETEKEQLEENAKNLREEAGGVVNIQQLLGGWEAIPAGTEMDHRMRLRGANETELAWAFFALHRLAREGRIGAHESTGEGYFRAEYEIRLAVDDGDFRAAGTLRLADRELRIDGDCPILTKVLERSKTLPDGNGEASS